MPTSTRGPDPRPKAHHLAQVWILRTRWTEIQRAALDRGLTASDFIREAIRDALDRHRVRGDEETANTPT